MTPSSPIPRGFLTFVLHCHLPYVINNGTWPHGEDWLYEAAAETYLPLLRVFGDLEKRGLALKANVSLSPILLEQLDHPRFKLGFPEYLQRKLDAAKADEKQFKDDGQVHFAELARYWQTFYTKATDEFREIDGNIIARFRHFYESGAIEIITTGATHAYFALLGDDNAIRAQVRVAVKTHQRFFGKRPRGIWLPECSYRPAGEWAYPVGASGAQLPFMRAGVEQILAENKLEFFFVDTSFVDKNVTFAPYESLAGDVPIATEVETDETASAKVYTPHFADTPDRNAAQVAFFTRDPRTAVQVWSGEHGYPADAVYLDFHKKHWPGGHRYWQVTNPKIDMGAKAAYFPAVASHKTRANAEHFVGLTKDVLNSHAAAEGGAPPILTAAFDAELFGHWWFEGPEFLRSVVLEYAKPDNPMQLTSCAEYLDRYGAAGYIDLPEGSWGAYGHHQVWMNHVTEWTWKHIYPAERAVQQVAHSGKWRDNEMARRLANQVCRELMLLEASDWQFLITTGHARDYAEKRFQGHLDNFRCVLDLWRRFEASGRISADGLEKLERIEEKDSVFEEISPEEFRS